MKDSSFLFTLRVLCLRGNPHNFAFRGRQNQVQCPETPLTLQSHAIFSATPFSDDFPDCGHGGCHERPRYGCC